jgi:hypothetical protein
MSLCHGAAADADEGRVGASGADCLHQGGAEDIAALLAGEQVDEWHGPPSTKGREQQGHPVTQATQMPSVTV